MNKSTTTDVARPGGGGRIVKTTLRHRWAMWCWHWRSAWRLYWARLNGLVLGMRYAVAGAVRAVRREVRRMERERPKLDRQDPQRE